MSDPGVVLLVTWDGGGNVPPMLALGRRLARRGHEVRVLGTPSLGDRVGHAGLDFAALGRVAELDRRAGTAMEDQVDAFVRQLAGPELGADVADALGRHRPDAVVIDCMQLAAFNAAETHEISTVALVHYLLCFASGSGLKIAIPLLNVSANDALRLLASASSTRAAHGWSSLIPRIPAGAAQDAETARRALAERSSGVEEEGRGLALDDAVAYAMRARGSRNRPAAGWASLTPTELRVVHLVAAGQTNPEIAAALFVSRATVKTHVSHALAKLGLSSRSEIAAEAGRRSG